MCAPTDGTQADPGAAGSTRSRNDPGGHRRVQPQPHRQGRTLLRFPHRSIPRCPRAGDVLRLASALAGGVRLRAAADAAASSSASYPYCRPPRPVAGVPSRRYSARRVAGRRGLRRRSGHLPAQSAGRHHADVAGPDPGRTGRLRRGDAQGGAPGLSAGRGLCAATGLGAAPLAVLLPGGAALCRCEPGGSRYRLSPAPRPVDRLWHPAGGDPVRLHGVLPHHNHRASGAAGPGHGRHRCCPARRRARAEHARAHGAAHDASGDLHRAAHRVHPVHHRRGRRRDDYGR